jgi:hypothetical protein
MNLLKSLTSIPDRLRGWLAPSVPASPVAMRASGNAMVHLADTLHRHAEEWQIGANSVSRKGMEVGWKGALAGTRARVWVKMDGADIHVTPPEAAMLKEALRDLLEQRKAKESAGSEG